MSILTNEKINSETLNDNFSNINVFFCKLFNKKELKELLTIFKFYDGNNNESLYIKDFLELINDWFIEPGENLIDDSGEITIQEYYTDEGEEITNNPEDDIAITESKNKVIAKQISNFDKTKAYWFLNDDNTNFTMYNFFIHFLKCSVIKSINLATKDGFFDTTNMAKPITDLINVVYDENNTVLKTMLIFFDKYYINDIFLNDNQFTQYREEFEKSITEISNNLTNEQEIEDVLKVISDCETKIKFSNNQLYCLDYKAFLNTAKLILNTKKVSFGTQDKTVQEAVQAQVNEANLKISTALAESNSIKPTSNIAPLIATKPVEQKVIDNKAETAEIQAAINQILNYTKRATINESGNNSNYISDFDNFFNNFLQCIQSGQKQYLDNMEIIMKEEIDELTVPYTFYYKTIWYILAIMGTGIFTTTNLKKSQSSIRTIKDFDWGVEIKNKNGEEIFKDKFWKYFASYANYMNEGYSQYNNVLKDKGFLNMQKNAVEASKILSQANDKELENIKKEIHKIFYEKIDFGIYVAHGGLYGATQNIADLMYELCSPIELTFNKNITASFFEEIKNAATMCVKGAAIEAIYFLCFNKFDFLGNCSLFDLINKLRYYNEIMKNAASLKIENQSIVKTNIILQSEEYIAKVKNGFGVFNNDPKIKNNCFWFVYMYIKKRNHLLGYDFRSTDSSWWREQIALLNDKESAFIYLAYISVFANKPFTATTFLQSFNESTQENLELDEISKNTYNNINSFFGLKGFSDSEYIKLSSEFINKGVFKSLFSTEDLVNFYSLQINELNRDNIMPLSFKTFSNRCESEFSYFYIEITENERTFIDQKLSSFNDDKSIFLMRFAPTMQLLLKNIPGFSSIINLENIINKFEGTINSLLLFVNDALNKTYNDLSSLEEKYTLEMMNKKYYYMAQAVPVAIDYIYKIITSANFSFATLIKQMEKSTIDFEDIIELNTIHENIKEQTTELQKQSTNSSIVVSEAVAINKEEYYAVKKLTEELNNFSEVYSEKGKVLFLSKINNSNLDISNEYANKIFVETIKEYVVISDKELEIITDYNKVQNFINKNIKNNETINKTLSSYTITKINIEDLQKSIKDNYVKKQVYGSKNIIELSNEAKQEKINLRFDLYK